MIQPEICGQEAKVKEVMSNKGSVLLRETNLRLADLQACFGIALHMHQPLIPAGGNIQTTELISNLKHMFENGEDYNASVFADCYGRIGDIVPELVREGRNPRVMLDYSGELFYGLKKMGRADVLERLRSVTVDPALRRHVEWLGTMWGHAVASSTPIPDLKLHMRAWQHEFAAQYGWEALGRVRGFSPPEMHLPNHPDAAYEYIRALKECGYRWLLVQEHTVEPVGAHGFDKHLPHRLMAKNSRGEEVTIIALIKTQGSDTKLVAQMQPFYEAKTQSRRTVNGISIPPMVTQIGDGENGGVMMNEFPPCFKRAAQEYGTTGVVAANGTEYLEMIEEAGVTESMLPALRPIGQGQVLERIPTWEPGAADRAIEELKREKPGFSMEGGSWTNNISWVRGYDNVLTPMNQLSARFHEVFDNRPDNDKNPKYQEALFYLLSAETSCFRYWGQGAWTDYAKEIIRRGTESIDKAR